jgi:hypothetical protein
VESSQCQDFQNEHQLYGGSEVASNRAQDNSGKNFAASCELNNLSPELNLKEMNDSIKNSREEDARNNHALQRKIAMRKQDLILNSVIMKDFGDEVDLTRQSRLNMKKCMIYPENQQKVKWDLFITL